MEVLLKPKLLHLPVVLLHHRQLAVFLELSHLKLKVKQLVVFLDKEIKINPNHPMVYLAVELLNNKHQVHLVASHFKLVLLHLWRNQLVDFLVKDKIHLNQNQI